MDQQSSVHRHHHGQNTDESNTNRLIESQGKEIENLSLIISKRSPLELKTKLTFIKTIARTPLKISQQHGDIQLNPGSTTQWWRPCLHMGR